MSLAEDLSIAERQGCTHCQGLKFVTEEGSERSCCNSCGKKQDGKIPFYPSKSFHYHANNLRVEAILCPECYEQDMIKVAGVSPWPQTT